MKLHNTLVLFTFIFFIMGCKSDASKLPKENNTSSKIYKQWLRDTLSVLNNEKYKTYYVNKDSSSLMIKSRIDTLVDPKSKVSNSKDLEYAVSLLQRNNITPKEKFRLIFVTQSYYDLPYKNVGLSYDFQIDVVNFYISTDKSKMEYKFMKGNLTDSIPISSLPEAEEL